MGPPAPSDRDLPYDEVYDEDGELVSSPRLRVQGPWTGPDRRAPAAP